MSDTKYSFKFQKFAFEGSMHKNDSNKIYPRPTLFTDDHQLITGKNSPRRKITSPLSFKLDEKLELALREIPSLGGRGNKYEEKFDLRAEKIFYIVLSLAIIIKYGI